LTLKVVSESRVTWPTSVPIFVFQGHVLDLDLMSATDRRQTLIQWPFDCRSKSHRIQIVVLTAV